MDLGCLFPHMTQPRATLRRSLSCKSMDIFLSRLNAVDGMLLLSDVKTDDGNLTRCLFVIV